MDVLFVVFGLVLLGVGGEFVVRGAVTLAERLDLSSLFVGLAVVALGTSTPELAVSVSAVLKGQTDIALGNVVGSNISNILLILALGALIHPIPASRHMVFRDALMLLLSSGLLLWLGTVGEINRPMGAYFLAMLLIYIAFSYFSERVRLTPAGERALASSEKARLHLPSLLLDIGIIVIGIVLLINGAGILVDGAVGLARNMGVSEAVIGLSVVAVGTSLPELAAVVAAAVRKQPELAVGSIIGSNIFNIFAVLGVTALVRPVYISPVMSNFHLWVMFAATAILIPFLVTNWRLSRIEGLVLLMGYGGYMWLLFGS